MADGWNSSSAPLFYADFCSQHNHFGFIFSFFFMSLAFLLATPTHVWCLWFYFTSERKSKKAPVFFLNLIIMELIYCLQCPVEIMNNLIFRNLQLYKLVLLAYSITWLGKPLLLTCICVEEYLAVIYPVTFLRLKGTRYRMCVATACWSMVSGYGVYMLITGKFNETLLLYVFFVAVAVISFCCVSVLCALKNPKPGDQHQKRSDVGNQQKRNAFNTISTKLLLTMMTYSPQVLLISHVLYVNRVLYKCDFIPVTVCFYVLGVIITPLLKMYKEGHLKCKLLII